MSLIYASPLLESRAALSLERQIAATPMALLGVRGVVTAPPVSDDPMRLAPMFARTILAVMENMIDRGLDPQIHEAERSDALQRHYYAQGRTRPGAIVTNAATADRSFHGFRLAVDIISRSKGWAAPMTFWTALGEEARKVRLVWGGSWRLRDYPHVQWSASWMNVPESPNDEMRRIWQSEGVMALWRHLGAV